MQCYYSVLVIYIANSPTYTFTIQSTLLQFNPPAFHNFNFSTNFSVVRLFSIVETLYLVTVDFFYMRMSIVCEMHPIDLHITMLLSAVLWARDRCILLSERGCFDPLEDQSLL